MFIQGKEYDLNVMQAAELLGYHPQTIRDLARAGKLPAFKRRHAWYFNKAELETYLVEESSEHIERSKTKHDLKQEFGGKAVTTDGEAPTSA